MTVSLPDVSPYVWGLAGLLIVALALAVALERTRQRADRPEHRTAPEDRLTLLAAGIATAVSAQGMWRFSGDVLHLNGWLRLLLFAFIEVAVATSAVRAKRSMRDNYSAGIDGIAVWALAALSAVLSSLDARSIAEAIFRLAAPLVAAWLWDRGMAIERRRITGRSRINWRLTPERIFVRLGLAEPSERTAGQVDAERRLTRVALAADRLADTEPGTRKYRRAMVALKRHGRAMVAHTAVASDPEQQAYLRAQITVAQSIGRLPEAADRPFWEPATDIRPDTSAVTSPTFEVSGPMSERWPDLVLDDDPEDGEADTDLDTELRTLLDTSSDRDSAHDGDQAPKRKRPDDQDNRAAEEWIRRQCRGRNGVGRRPTRGEVRDRQDFSRFSDGWAGLRISAVQDRMSAQGYTFADDGAVYGPTRAATVNGSENPTGGTE